MRYFVHMIALLALAMVWSGCGAMFQGSSQTIYIQSTPSGAKVTGSPSIGEYTTPTSVELPRKNSYTLTFTKEGYKSGSAYVRASAKFGYILLDVLFTGLVGVVVDAATGGWNGFTPETVIVTLEKEDLGVAGPAQIDVRLSVANSKIQIESDADPVQVVIERSE